MLSGGVHVTGDSDISDSLSVGADITGGGHVTVPGSVRTRGGVQLGRIDASYADAVLSGEDADGNPVYLKDIWPSTHEVQDTVNGNVTSDMFRKSYSSVFQGDERWNAIDSPSGEIFEWDGDSTYIQNPPYFQGMTAEPPGIPEIRGARCLARLGDSITTDHISPAGAIASDGPAGKYLQEQGVSIREFNSFGSRRGNDRVMVRGTFANIRIRNQLAPGTEGGLTTYLPGGEVMPIFEASEKYKRDGTPLLVIAGAEYGTGSSRDWAAKGTLLLGVKGVLAESFERIHRSNLVGMGVLPLVFKEGDSVAGLGLSGDEVFTITGIEDIQPRKMLQVKAEKADGHLEIRFVAA